jgi:hypothetical protein
MSDDLKRFSLVHDSEYQSQMLRRADGKWTPHDEAAATITELRAEVATLRARVVEVERSERLRLEMLRDQGLKLEQMKSLATAWEASAGKAWAETASLRADAAALRAEVERLRDALRDIVDTGGRFGSAAHMKKVDLIARAALTGGAA